MGKSIMMSEHNKKYILPTYVSCCYTHSNQARRIRFIRQLPPYGKATVDVPARSSMSSGRKRGVCRCSPCGVTRVPWWQQLQYLGGHDTDNFVEKLRALELLQKTTLMLISIVYDCDQIKFRLNSYEFVQLCRKAPSVGLSNRTRLRSSANRNERFKPSTTEPVLQKPLRRPACLPLRDCSTPR
jgi:hypothetical protein